MVMVYVLLSISIMILFTLLLRLAPIWRQRHRGVDAYYFLLTAEEFKKQKRIPIKLPSYYLLDIEEQWYPPGFSVFLGLLPQRFLYRFYWLISPILDACNLVVLLIFTYLLTSSLNILFLAGIVYALTPILMTESTTLTSRPLGNFFFTGEMLSFAFYYQQNSILFLILAMIFGFLIFATHKVSMQLLCFFCIGLAIVFRSVTPLLILMSIFVLSLVIFRGYFFKILKGYYDILVFWHRNWNYLGAHQVYGSPIYLKNENAKEDDLPPLEKNTAERAFSYLKKVKSSILRKNKALYFFLIGLAGKSSNPFVMLFLLGGFRLFTTFTPLDKVIFFWAFLAFVWMLLTTFVPYLRLFGEGYKYMRMTAFPASYIISLYFIQGDLSLFELVLVLIVFLFSIGRWFLTYRQFSRMELISEDVMRMFEYIKNHEEIDYIACFNVNLADSLVYHCRRRVLWGTHHDSFNTKVVDFYPVLRKPLKWFEEKYGIKYVLIDTDYVKPQDVELEEKQIAWKSGKYTLYKLDEQNSGIDIKS